VLAFAGAATALGAVTVAGASNNDDSLLVPVIAGWWLIALIFGLWVGRSRNANVPIGRLLATAKSVTSLPEQRPGLLLLNRLWPLLLATVGTGALAFKFPQVPGIFAGFALGFAIAMRHQEKAVAAIEDRDGAAFYVERTSPLRPIQLVRTPSFRRDVVPV
jgi:hypothetical protein